MARILVAEDDDSVRDFIQRGLALHGYQVESAADGGAALERLRDSGPFDLLLTDIAMPVMDGLALALKVSADYPELPVLMMSGFAHERQRAYNLEDLIIDVLEKPFTLEQLMKTIRRGLEGDRFRSRQSRL